MPEPPCPQCGSPYPQQRKKGCLETVGQQPHAYHGGRYALRGFEPRSGGETCRRCGHTNPPWSAASPLWNAIMRGGSIDGGPEPFAGIICAACFIDLAAEAGCSGFRLTATEHPPLETTTASGRVWDDAAFMWVEPASSGPQSPASQGLGEPTEAEGGATGLSQPRSSAAPTPDADDQAADSVGTLPRELDVVTVTGTVVGLPEGAVLVEFTDTFGRGTIAEFSEEQLAASRQGQDDAAAG